MAVLDSLLQLLGGGDPYSEALRQYPALRGQNVQPVQGDRLEYYPPGERERPPGLPYGTAGVQYPPQASPADVAGDIVSHHMTRTDPTIAGFYNNFAASMTPDQQARLRGQYDYAAANFGERRPFEEWAAISGVPAYFRGHPFQQWPQDFNQRAYTVDQRTELDRMLQYLRTGRPGEPTP